MQPIRFTPDLLYASLMDCAQSRYLWTVSSFRQTTNGMKFFFEETASNSVKNREIDILFKSTQVLLIFKANAGKTDKKYPERQS